MIDTFGVILADPPWRYRNGGNGAAKNHYPTLSTAQICDLQPWGHPVAALGCADSVLLLWCTWPLMPDGLRVVEAWGYTYVTGFPWLKLAAPPAINLFGELDATPAYGTGMWVRGCSEYVMVSRRGKVEPSSGALLGLLSERFRHSRKPDNLYHYAEALPGPYLELFARRARRGWTAWGNEIGAQGGTERDRAF
jgi:N6-adenosine-specific RNA methylase IME4